MQSGDVMTAMIIEQRGLEAVVEMYVSSAPYSSRTHSPMLPRIREETTETANEIVAIHTAAATTPPTADGTTTPTPAMTAALTDVTTDEMTAETMIEGRIGGALDPGIVGE